MLVSEVRKLSPLERFLYWTRERNQILLKRRAGQQKPWTDDEVLQSYSFTNVMRENDRVTLWFKDNVRERLSNDPIVVFATIAFRWFNLPQPTGEYLNSHRYFEEWNLEKVVAGLTEFKNRGLKVFTGAFNISNGGSTDPKIDRVCEGYIQPVWQQRATLYQKLNIGNGSLRSAFDRLHQLPGLGGSGFMAAQIVCDLAYTHVLENAPDWWTWSSWGPGSKRGMNRVLGNSVDCPISQPRWKQHLDNLQAVIEQRLGLKLHARDVQNCLCEFSKYECGLWGDGHIKRRYPGR
jgi:hypothetical protein